MLETAPDLIGYRDQPEAFDPPPGLIRRMHRHRPGLRIGGTWRVYEVLVPTVLGQKVTNREARLAGARLVRRYGESAPGPGELRLMPQPDVMRGLSYWDLHPLGVERKRAEILFEIAWRSQRLEEIVQIGRSAAMERLAAVRGIGP